MTCATVSGSEITDARCCGASALGHESLLRETLGMTLESGTDRGPGRDGLPASAAASRTAPGWTAHPGSIPAATARPSSPGRPVRPCPWRFMISPPACASRPAASSFRPSVSAPLAGRRALRATHRRPGVLTQAQVTRPTACVSLCCASAETTIPIQRNVSRRPRVLTLTAFVTTASGVNLTSCSGIHVNLRLM